MKGWRSCGLAVGIQVVMAVVAVTTDAQTLALSGGRNPQYGTVHPPAIRQPPHYNNNYNYYNYRYSGGSRDAGRPLTPQLYREQAYRTTQPGTQQSYNHPQLGNRHFNRPQLPSSAYNFPRPIAQPSRHSTQPSNNPRLHPPHQSQPQDHTRLPRPHLQAQEHTSQLHITSQASTHNLQLSNDSKLPSQPPSQSHSQTQLHKHASQPPQPSKDDKEAQQTGSLPQHNSKTLQPQNSPQTSSQPSQPKHSPQHNSQQRPQLFWFLQYPSGYYNAWLQRNERQRTIESQARQDPVTSPPTTTTTTTTASPEQQITHTNSSSINPGAAFYQDDVIMVGIPAPSNVTLIAIATPVHHHNTPALGKGMDLLHKTTTDSPQQQHNHTSSSTTDVNHHDAVFNSSVLARRDFLHSTTTVLPPLPPQNQMSFATTEASTTTADMKSKKTGPEGLEEAKETVTSPLTSDNPIPITHSPEHNDNSDTLENVSEDAAVKHTNSSLVHIKVTHNIDLDVVNSDVLENASTDRVVLKFTPSTPAPTEFSHGSDINIANLSEMIPYNSTLKSNMSGGNSISPDVEMRDTYKTEQEKVENKVHLTQPGTGNQGNITSLASLSTDSIGVTENVSSTEHMQLLGNASEAQAIDHANTSSLTSANTGSIGKAGNNSSKEYSKSLNETSKVHTDGTTSQRHIIPRPGLSRCQNRPHHPHCTSPSLPSSPTQKGQLPRFSPATRRRFPFRKRPIQRPYRTRHRIAGKVRPRKVLPQFSPSSNVKFNLLPNYTKSVSEMQKSPSQQPRPDVSQVKTTQSLPEESLTGQQESASQHSPSSMSDGKTAMSLPNESLMTGNQDLTSQQLSISKSGMKMFHSLPGENFNVHAGNRSTGVSDDLAVRDVPVSGSLTTHKDNSYTKMTNKHETDAKQTVSTTISHQESEITAGIEDSSTMVYADDNYSSDMTKSNATSTATDEDNHSTQHKDNIALEDTHSINSTVQINKSVHDDHTLKNLSLMQEGNILLEGRHHDKNSTVHVNNSLSENHMMDNSSLMQQQTLENLHNTISGSNTMQEKDWKLRTRVCSGVQCVAEDSTISRNVDTMPKNLTQQQGNLSSSFPTDTALLEDNAAVKLHPETTSGVKVDRENPIISITDKPAHSLHSENSDAFQPAPESDSVLPPTMENDNSKHEVTLEKDTTATLSDNHDSSNESSTEFYLGIKVMVSSPNSEATEASTFTPQANRNLGVQRLTPTVKPHTIMLTNIHKPEEARITTVTTAQKRTNTQVSRHTPSLFDTHTPSQSQITHTSPAAYNSRTYTQARLAYQQDAVRGKERSGVSFLGNLPPFLRGSVNIERADLGGLGGVAISDSYGIVTYQQQ